jgi:hypothetical protein
LKAKSQKTGDLVDTLNSLTAEQHQAAKDAAGTLLEHLGDQAPGELADIANSELPQPDANPPEENTPEENTPEENTPEENRPAQSSNPDDLLKGIASAESTKV